MEMMIYKRQTSRWLVLEVLLFISSLQFQCYFAQNVTDLANSAGTKIFLDRLFIQYGENNGTSMSPTNFSIFLKQLSVGSVVLESPDKYCKYKGVHTGIEKEPGKTDSVSNDKSKSGTKIFSNNAQHEHGNLLRRERRSGGHDHDNKKAVKENPKHNLHLQKHYQQVSIVFIFIVERDFQHTSVFHGGLIHQRKYSAA